MYDVYYQGDVGAMSIRAYDGCGVETDAPEN